MIGEFRRVGNMLFLMHMVDALSGNMSMLAKNGIWITKTGVSLYNLRMKDIVNISFDKDIRWNAASSEVDIHTNIYRNIKSARAILHAHPINTIKLSFYHNRITPKDYEGSLFLGYVDVLNIDFRKWDEAKDLIVDYFKTSDKNVVVARGHGVFIHDKTLLGALKFASALENSCKILV